MVFTFLTATWLNCAHARNLVVERTINDAGVFLSTAGEAVDPSLLERLMVGDVSELKPAEQTTPFARTIPLPARATITLDVPAKVIFESDAGVSSLELTVLSSELNAAQAFAVDASAAGISLRGPRPGEFCALGLVRGRPTSVLGTCAVARVSVKTGDQVKVFVRDHLVDGTRDPSFTMTP